MCRGSRKRYFFFLFLLFQILTKLRCDIWMNIIRVKRKIYRLRKQIPSSFWNVNYFLCTDTSRWILPCNRLMGNCHRTGSHFHLHMDYNGVAFSKDLRMRVGKGGRRRVLILLYARILETFTRHLYERKNLRINPLPTSRMGSNIFGIWGKGIFGGKWNYLEFGIWKWEDSRL